MPPVEDSPVRELPENEVLARLRAGEEQAFSELVELHAASMLRVARTYVRDAAVAEEVVQETWLALLQGIDRFEGRSSLRTWLFTILANRARTRGERESRGVPFSSVSPSIVLRSSPAAFSPPTTRGGPTTGPRRRAPGRSRSCSQGRRCR